MSVLERGSNIEVVGEASDAEQALSDLQSLEVDVVLMDVGLPEMSGVEATRRLNEMRPDLPVLVMTAFGDEYVEKAITAGARGYVLKTSPSRQLIGAIQAVQRGDVFIDPSLTARLDLGESKKGDRNGIH